MSGHSKWAKIKRKKGANDIKKGEAFTKLSKDIALAAKEGGADPEMNFALRLAVNKAKSANMPSDKIEKAIARGAGTSGDDFEIKRITYEAFAPGGVALIIDTQTDNTNRTVSEVKRIVENFGGKFASAGSVSWQFHEKGSILIHAAKIQEAEQYGKKETFQPVDVEIAQLEILNIEGVEDIELVEDSDDQGEPVHLIEITTTKEDFAHVLKEIESLSYRVESAELIKRSKEEVQVTPEEQERLLNFVQELEGNDDVSAVWLAAKILL